MNNLTQGNVEERNVASYPLTAAQHLPIYRATVPRTLVVPETIIASIVMWQLLKHTHSAHWHEERTPFPRPPHIFPVDQLSLARIAFTRGEPGHIFTWGPHSHMNGSWKIYLSQRNQMLIDINMCCVQWLWLRQNDWTLNMWALIMSNHYWLGKGSKKSGHFSWLFRRRTPL